MKGNTLSLCRYTPSHLGWMPQLLIRNYGYSPAPQAVAG